MHWRVILGLCAALLSAGLRADVLQTLAVREGMAGQFTQEIISPEGEVLERSNGNFSLLRPHIALPHATLPSFRQHLWRTAPQLPGSPRLLLRPAVRGV